jgi:hypothetical protein
MIDSITYEKLFIRSKIKHRLFSQNTMNLTVRPLTSIEVIVNLIAGTNYIKKNILKK